MFEGEYSRRKNVHERYWRAYRRGLAGQIPIQSLAETLKTGITARYHYATVQALQYG